MKNPVQDEWRSKDGSVRLILGDCLKVLQTLEAGSVDAVVTDPPYGIELGNANNQSHDGSHLAKQGYIDYDDTYEQFVSLIVPRINASLDICKRGCVFTGPHITEQKKPSAIGGVYCPGALGRTPWGSKEFLPILLYGSPSRSVGQHRPMVLRSSASAEKNEHPCPKPIVWMVWIVGQYTEPNETVLDPFMGSGTTGVACIKTGRKFVGVEINPDYFSVAVNRIKAALRKRDSSFQIPSKPRTVPTGFIDNESLKKKRKRRDS